MHPEASLPRLDRVESGENLDPVGRQSHLLLGLAQCRGQEVAVARLRPATRQADLAPVDAPVGAYEQQDPEDTFCVPEHRRQDSRILERRGRDQTSARSRSAIVSRFRIRRAAPSCTSTAAGRVTPL